MTASISQWDAFMIETLVYKGVAREDILKYVKNEELDKLKNIDQSFDYTDLVESVKQNESKFEKAILQGYTIKFLTKPGLQKILLMKYQAEKGKSYQLNGNRFEDIVLSEEQLLELKVILSSNWKMVYGEVVSIVPVNQN